MKSVILCKTYTDLPVCDNEILRYAGCKNADENTVKLINECLAEVKNKLTYKVCYGEFSVKVKDNICVFGDFSFKSDDLAKTLKNCTKAVIFAATVGVEIDRLILKYGKLSPAKALLMQAIGAERIETLCDAFCLDLKKEYGTGLTMRFSAGYGDLPLESQKQIFQILNCEKRIGLTLTDSLIMSPAKSVTAIVGLGGNDTKNKCENCNNIDCAFRGEK